MLVEKVSLGAFINEFKGKLSHQVLYSNRFSVRGLELLYEHLSKEPASGLTRYVIFDKTDIVNRYAEYTAEQFYGLMPSEEADDPMEPVYHLTDVLVGEDERRNIYIVDKYVIYYERDDDMIYNPNRPESYLAIYFPEGDLGYINSQGKEIVKNEKK